MTHKWLMANPLVWYTYNKRGIKRRNHFSNISSPTRTSTKEKSKTIRDHPFRAYAKFSEKLTFLTPWYVHEPWFFPEDFAYVLNGRTLSYPALQLPLAGLKNVKNKLTLQFKLVQYIW